MSPLTMLIARRCLAVGYSDGYNNDDDITRDKETSSASYGGENI